LLNQTNSSAQRPSPPTFSTASVMCGRRPRVKGFLAFSERSGASHVSGLFARRPWPLALM
jgi:hypothetical protein